MLRDTRCNRQVGLSLPGSGPLSPALWEPLAVLRSMRDSSGGPNLRMRLLAVLVALLLAGPLTVALVRGAAAAVRLAL